MKKFFFIVLLWLRGPVKFILRLIGGFAFLGTASAGLMLLLATGAPDSLRIGFWGGLGISFFAFVISWVYDRIILALSDGDIVLFD